MRGESSFYLRFLLRNTGFLPADNGFKRNFVVIGIPDGYGNYSSKEYSARKFRPYNNRNACLYNSSGFRKSSLG